MGGTANGNRDCRRWQRHARLLSATIPSQTARWTPIDSAFAEGRDFGTAKTFDGFQGSTLRRFRIRNVGGIPITPSLPAFTGADAADFTVTNVSLPEPLFLNPFEEVLFDIVFNPSTGGNKEATVEIAYSDTATFSFGIIGEAEQSSPPALSQLEEEEL